MQISKNTSNMNAITAASRNESLRRSPLLQRRKFPRRPTLTLDSSGNLVPGVYLPDEEHHDKVLLSPLPSSSTMKKNVKPFVKKIDNGLQVIDDHDSMCTVSTAGETCTTYSLTPTTCTSSSSPVVIKQMSTREQQQPQHMPLMNYSDFQVPPPPLPSSEREKQAVLLANEKKKATIAAAIVASKQKQAATINNKQQQQPAVVMNKKSLLVPPSSSTNKTTTTTSPIDKRPNNRTKHMPLMNLSDISSSLVPASPKNTTTTQSSQSKTSLSSVKERRALAQQWYIRFGKPNRDEMKHRITQLKFCGIVARDVNLLPWTADGSKMVTDDDNDEGGGGVATKMADGRCSTSVVVKVNDNTRSSSNSCRENAPSLIRSTIPKKSGTATSESSSPSSPSSSVPWAKVALKKTGIKVVVEQPRYDNERGITAKDTAAIRGTTMSTPQRCKSTSASAAVKTNKKKEVVVVEARPKTATRKNKSDADDDDDDKSIELTYLYEPRRPKDTSASRSIPAKKIPIVVAVSKHHDSSSSQVHASKHDKTNNTHTTSQRSIHRQESKKCIYLPPSCKLISTGGRNKVTISKSLNDSKKDVSTSVPGINNAETTAFKRCGASPAPKALVLNSKGDLIPSPPPTHTGVTTTTESSANEDSIGGGINNNPWARVKLKKTISSGSPSAVKDMKQRAGKSEVGRALW